MEVQSNQQESKAEMILQRIFVWYYTVNESMSSTADSRKKIIELILGTRSHRSSVPLKSRSNQSFCSSSSPCKAT